MDHGIFEADPSGNRAQRSPLGWRSPERFILPFLYNGGELEIEIQQQPCPLGLFPVLWQSRDDPEPPSQGQHWNSPGQDFSVSSDPAPHIKPEG